MDKKQQNNISKPKQPISKSQVVKEQGELGFDNDQDKAKALELTDKAKSELIKQFLNQNPSSNEDASYSQSEANLSNYIKNEIYISLSVEDIYKLINKQELIHITKFNLVDSYCLFTSLFLQVLLLALLAYLRPTLMTNKHSCFDQHSLNYIDCDYRNLCLCQKSLGCVSFCYNQSVTNCTEKFKSENINREDSFISYFGQLVYVKYAISPTENKSFFQRINRSYCYSELYMSLLSLLFVIGGIIGYSLFGPIADVLGKKKAISTMIIALIVFSIPIVILTYFDMANDNVPFIIAWSFIYFLIGLVLLPLDSCLLLYVLENCPLSEKLKALNAKYIVREALGLFIYYLFDYYVGNIAYVIYFIELYLLIFVFALVFYFNETPRFYSERRKRSKLKAKSIRFFTKPWAVYSTMTHKKKKTFGGFKRIALINKCVPPKVNSINQQSSPSTNRTNEHLPLLNNAKDNPPNRKAAIFSPSSYEIIKRKYYKNKHIEKYYYLMLFCFGGISACYYTIILSLIRNLMNPNLPYDEIEKLFAALYIFLFVFILIPLLNKIIMECFSFEGLIPYLLVFFTVVSILFDIPDFNNSARAFFYGNDFERKLKLKNLYVQGTSFWLIVWIYHIYEFLLMRQAPTLYRTIFFFNQKAVCQIAILFAVISVYILDTSVVIAGILGGIVTLLFFALKINWKYEMFEENKDIEEKQRMNKRKDKL